MSRGRRNRKRPGPTSAPSPDAGQIESGIAEPTPVGHLSAPLANGTEWGADGPELGALLADAQRAVLDREERRLAERRQGERRASEIRPAIDPVWLTMASISWLAVILALLSPPAFMQAPSPAPFAPAAGALEPSLRYGLWLARNRVDAFSKREGRLPSFLGETGMRDDALRMEVVGERSYRLVASLGERPLVLTDRMAADSFLGGSLDRLRAGE